MTRSQLQTLIESLADNQPNTAATVRGILSALADGTATTGDIKQIDVSTAYIAANFDITGLGTNERLGWAICNGNNGTRNRNGRVALQYDPSNYPTLGATGGNNSIALSKNNIPLLDLTVPVSTGDNAGGEKLYIMYNNFEPNGNGTWSNSVNQGTTNAPVDIRQQYIVTLFIQKL